MWTWIADNSATIIALAAVLLIIGTAILTLVHDKKKGTSSCGCHCANCPMTGKCRGGSDPGNANPKKECCAGPNRTQ